MVILAGDRGRPVAGHGERRAGGAFWCRRRADVGRSRTGRSVLPSALTARFKTITHPGTLATARNPPQLPAGPSRPPRYLPNASIPTAITNRKIAKPRRSPSWETRFTSAVPTVTPTKASRVNQVIMVQSMGTLPR